MVLKKSAGDILIGSVCYEPTDGIQQNLLSDCLTQVLSFMPHLQGTQICAGVQLSACFKFFFLVLE